MSLQHDGKTIAPIFAAAYEQLNRQGRLFEMARAVHCSENSLRVYRYRPEKMGKRPAIRIYAYLVNEGIISGDVPMSEVFVKFAEFPDVQAQAHLCSGVTKIHKGSLAAFWIEWKVPVPVIRRIYRSTGNLTTKSQANIFLRNAPLAEKRSDEGMIAS